ncbi:MAG TPA: BTAD domain-containing putative transcriptional regulator [Gemmatimonadales bacterium]|nr:BTAD domain-containing putative transcriptional regulator [Gemmatimonadales bacterium]
MRLRTFGGLWIEAGAAPVPPDLRPRWLALLAIVAAAGPKGASRERLLGILWPEVDEERARHALSQTLYSLRRDLQAEPVAGSGELRLDPLVMGSDVGDLLSAAARNDRTTTLDLYHGWFLEGFYLDGAVEFERWVEEERTRFRRLALRCAESLAEEASASGDAARAAFAWRRPAQLDPLSARHAVSYMKALVDAGDRAGALAHAREHEALVRRELDAAPDAEVTALAERLRRSSSPSRTPEPQVHASPAPAAPPPAPPAQLIARPTRSFAWLIAAIVVIILVVLAARSLMKGRPESGAPVLAVGRLRDAPSSDSSNFSGVLTDMLATNLARVHGIQVVANSRLFELMQPGQEDQRGAFSEAARRAGAREILEGELSYAPVGGLQLDLRRIDLQSGVVRSGYRVRALDRYALVDSATAAVARDFSLNVPGGAIAEVSTSSPLAYRLYEEGLRSYYQYDVAAAFRLMQAALKEDSTFAIAAYYAWISSGSPLDGPNRQYLDRVVRLAPNAPERERLLILGTVLRTTENPAAVAYAESLSIRFPTDPEGQTLLGDVKSVLGEYPASTGAYNRAVALDSSAKAIGGEACRACKGLNHLASTYVAWDSFPAAERTVQRWLRFEPGKLEPLVMLAELDARTGRWSELHSLYSRMDSLDPTRRADREWYLYHLIRRGDYDSLPRSVLQTLQEPGRDQRTDAVWLWIIALRNQGRLIAANEMLRGHLPDGTQLSPEAIGIVPVEAATVAFESGQSLTAARLYSTLVGDNASNPFPGHRARGMTWNLALEATARAAAGDTAAVRLLADSVETLGRLSLVARSSHLHHFLRGLLLASDGRHAEAVNEYRRAITSWTDGYTRINYELSRSLLALNRPAEAIYPLQAALRGAIDASNLYITRTELHEELARAFAAAGQRDSAAVHYREVVRAWEPGDPPFQARRRAAMHWLAGNSA